MHTVAAAMLTEATRSGPRCWASEPARGAMKIMGMPKRLIVRPMNIWLAPRSARKMAQTASKTPMVIQNATPSARHACMEDLRISEPITGPVAGLLAPGMSTRQTMGASSTRVTVMTTKVDASPAQRSSSAASTGPSRKPAVSYAVNRPMAWPALAGSEVSVRRRTAGRTHPAPNPSRARAAIQPARVSATAIHSVLSAEIASPARSMAAPYPRSA